MSRRREAAVLFVAALLAYLPVLHAGFVWDDDGHVTRAALRSWAGLARIWFSPGATQQYYPVLHTAFWIEHHLWGDWTAGYHLLNVLLHATSACLLVAVLRRLRIPGAFLAGLIFALHPLCVESVAWVSEQKNTLSGVFYFAAALAFLRWRGEPEAAKPGPPRLYFIAAGFFLLALLSKSVTAMLPAGLIVACAWQRGRVEWRRTVLPLAPWLAIGAAGGLFTAYVERRFIGAQGAAFGLNALERCLLAGRIAWFYAGKVLWPAKLIFIYPHWTIEAADPLQWFPLAGLLALAAVLAWTGRSGRGPAWAALCGGAFFLATLFPALGFVNVYPFKFSYVADHFQYLACLGLIVPLAAVAARRWPPAAGPAAAVGLLAVLAVLTFRQARTYRDLHTLYQTTIDRNPGCWLAYANLGSALIAEGRYADALPDLEEALRLQEEDPLVLNDLGDALNRLGRSAEAIAPLEHALRLEPVYPEAHNNLGAALMGVNRPADGLAQFQQAVAERPDYAVGQFNLGLALASSGKPAEAIGHFERVVRLQPNYPDAELGWAVSLTALGQPQAAIAHYRQALDLNPDSAEAHYNLALVLRQLGQTDEAAVHYQEALRLRGAQGR
ncbi:MAG TPA: tetratricopeptide repeat protein [Opitutaceae bacterium]|jgi:tetratricopeptide (TPR) repeat protein|nr:tetratricopeptide repeat protein [Opitutaceae bacterium]